MLAAQASSCKAALPPPPCPGPAGQRWERAWRQQHAAEGRAPAPYRGRRRSGVVAARAAADFQQLRGTAQDSVAAAQAKLSALEAAQRTAAQAREPAAEAERHWQDLHSRLTALTKEAQEATKSLRTAVTAAAGGEAEATHALLQVGTRGCSGVGGMHAWARYGRWSWRRLRSAQCHVQVPPACLHGCLHAGSVRCRFTSRSGWMPTRPPTAFQPPLSGRWVAGEGLPTLAQLGAGASIAGPAPAECKSPAAPHPACPNSPTTFCVPQLYPVQDLPLHSIPGGRMLYQLAAAEVDGQPFAVVAVGISNPFMVGGRHATALL